MTVKKIIDENEEERFYVEITEDLDDSTTLITSNKEYSQKLINNALSSYAGNDRTYSRSLTEQSLMSTTLTEAKIEYLAKSAQDDLHKIQEINTFIDLYLNKDDIIGKTYEIIEANTNAQYQLSYPSVEGRNKNVQLDKVKSFINDFNEQIELEELIIETIPYVYSTGNRIYYLRKTKYDTYQVEKYPLGMAQISDYKINNEPVVYLSMSDIIGRMTGVSYLNPMSSSILSNIDLKTYESLEEDIKANFPKEVYKAYLADSSTLIKLNTDLSAVIRTNNRGKKYGLSPIFKALNPALKLEVQEKADSMDSKARAKKIIFQQISDKLLGDDGTDVDLGMTIYSHNELIKAWKNEVVLYTGSPAVKDLKYVEPKADTDRFNSLNYYNTKVMSALGISFLSGESKQGLVSSQISLTELMRVIDKISKQLEHNINKWYKHVLHEAGLPVKYAPKIKVLDSELLEMELRMQLADNLFNKYGMSYESTYNMLGVDFNTEKERRILENEENLDLDVFAPRMTNFTFSKANDKDYDEVDKREDNVDNKDVTKTNKTVNQKEE